MTHPVLVETDPWVRPWWERVREIALSFPEAQEKITHGRSVFFTKKIFAIFGGSVKGDHDNPRYRCGMLFVPDEAEREALEQDDRFFAPAYYGPFGWLGLSFPAMGDDVADTDWDEVAELMDASYRSTAPSRLVQQLRYASDGDQDPTA